MQVVYKEDIASKMYNAILEAKRNNKPIDRLVLNESETTEFIRYNRIGFYAVNTARVRQGLVGGQAYLGLFDNIPVYAERLPND